MKYIIVLISFLANLFADNNTNTIEQNYKREKMILLVKVSQGEGSTKELEETKIFYVDFIKHLKNNDGSDYLLCKLLSKIKHKEMITHVIIGGRFEGGKIQKNIEMLPVNIAYVINNKLLNENYMDFSKGEFVGIGEATDYTKEYYTKSDSR